MSSHRCCRLELGIFIEPCLGPARSSGGVPWGAVAANCRTEQVAIPLYGQRPISSYSVAIGRLYHATNLVASSPLSPRISIDGCRMFLAAATLFKSTGLDQEPMLLRSGLIARQGFPAKFFALTINHLVLSRRIGGICSDRARISTLFWLGGHLLFPCAH